MRGFPGCFVSSVRSETLSIKGLKSRKNETYRNEGERLLYMAGVNLELRIYSCLGGVSLPDDWSRDAGISKWYLLTRSVGGRRSPSPPWRGISLLRYLGKIIAERENRSGRSSNHLER